MQRSWLGILAAVLVAGATAIPTGADAAGWRRPYTVVGYRYVVPVRTVAYARTAVPYTMIGYRAARMTSLATAYRTAQWRPRSPLGGRRGSQPG